MSAEFYYLYIPITNISEFSFFSLEWEEKLTRDSYGNIVLICLFLCHYTPSSYLLIAVGG